MFDIDHWREIFQTLGQNKLRTALTAFGVGWGILMLILMLGMGKGLENGVKSEMGALSNNSLAVWTQSTSMPYQGLPRGRRFEMNNSDIAALKTLSEIDIVAPRNQLGGYRGGNNVKRKSESGAFSIMGDYPEIIDIKLWEIPQGRFINKLDLDDRRKVCVIGNTVRDILFDPSEDPIGDHVRINGVYFKVIGVFKSPRGGERGEREGETIIIPFTTFQKAFNYGDVVGWFAMTAMPDARGAEAEESVKTFLKKRHKVHPDDPRAFGGYNVQEEFEETGMIFVGIELLSWIVGIMTLLAGSIGISNIMLVIIKERTKEIGVRRAIGASPFKVVSQIVMETVILNAVAGYVGLVIGVGLLALLRSAGLEAEFFKNPEVNLDIAFTALTVLIVAGLFAGLIPAYRAVSIRPVDALRSE